MAKEILVNAGDLEARVAILEDGRLAELHIEREPRLVGNIYKARVANILPGMDAAFADIGLGRNAFLSVSDIVAEREDEAPPERERQRRPTIEELVKPGQEVLVQVVRAPLGSKGARVGTRLALPGRYLVLLLTDGEYVGISRKIEEERERKRLRTMAEKIRPAQQSLIVRTEAEGKTRKDLQKDLDFLKQVAQRIRDKAKSAKAPALIHEDLSLVYKLVRDSFTRDVKRLVVDSRSVYDNILELLQIIAPNLRSRVSLYTDRVPLFHAYDLETELDRLLRPRVWLSAGGHINIDQTEALTAIDVNTGRFTGSTRLAETILQTNLQAADEIARQLRLRDLGGLIVVDFIDMDKPRHRTKLMQAFEDALKKDRAKSKILHISPLGLVEMTRKRSGESLPRMMTQTCPTCNGQGRIRSPLTLSTRIEREVARLCAEKAKPELFVVRAHPRVTALLIGFQGERATLIEEQAGVPIYVRAHSKPDQEAYEVIPADLTQLSKLAITPRRNEELEVEVLPEDEVVSSGPLATIDGYWIAIEEGSWSAGTKVKVRLISAGRSFGIAKPVGTERPSRPRRLQEQRSQPKPRQRSRGQRRAPQPGHAPDQPVLAPPRTARRQTRHSGQPRRQR